jgi:hypothetical protein
MSLVAITLRTVMGTAARIQELDDPRDHAVIKESRFQHGAAPASAEERAVAHAARVERAQQNRRMSDAVNW